MRRTPRKATSAEREKDAEGAPSYRISLPSLGLTLWFTEEGKMLRAETGRGLALEIEE